MPTKAPDYEQTVLQKRQQRERNLAENDKSWLCLAGLFRLKEGRNTFGSDPANDIVLTGSSIPPRVGTFTLQKNEVSVRASPGAPLACEGTAVTARIVHTDQHEHPDFLTLGSHSLLVIQRGDRILIRHWDSEHPNRKQFTGLKQYPVKPHFCISADFIHYDEPRLIKITNVLGDQSDVPHPGYAVFTLDGVECRMEAMGDDDGLYFNFTDLTNGDTTYRGGRSLETGLPEGGKVALDFNLAHNPPCAYTDFATCPLPPEDNRLAVRIEAGEQAFPREHA
ncbi:MAG: DUF1684 domain-containing protein [Chloroflexi bacterium]|nr:DUF1684 domain-containing protein [Chloroflexota bacterium]